MKAGTANARIHEALPGIDDAPVLDQHGGNLERATALPGHEPVGFKVDDGVAGHGGSWQRTGASIRRPGLRRTQRAAVLA